MDEELKNEEVQPEEEAKAEESAEEAKPEEAAEEVKEEEAPPTKSTEAGLVHPAR